MGKISIIPKTNFNKNIQNKLINLKNLALDYINDLFNLFIQRELPREFMENKLILFKIYLINTFDSKLIGRLCSNFEIIKTKFPGIIKNISFLDSQISDSKY